MFTRIRTTLIAMFFSLLPLYAAADGLLTTQIQEAWRDQPVLTGTFRTVYGDSTEERGTFRLDGPKKLTLSYPGTNAKMVFTGRGIQQIDVNYPSNNGFHEDIRLTAVFSHNPTFAGHIDGKNSNREYTLLVFRADEGETRIYFSNDTARLHMLALISPGGKTLTEFTYN